MHRLTGLIIALLTLSLAASCIQNDLPYPVDVPVIETITLSTTGAGARPVLLSKTTGTQSDSISVNDISHTVTAIFPEDADLAKVKVGLTFSGELAKTTPYIDGRVFDLRNPLKFSIATWPDQQYNWELVCKQDIEMYFTVKGQIGPSVIDKANHRVLLYVPESADIDNLEVTGFKLGPAEISSYKPALASVSDFSDVVKVEVSSHSRTEQWEIFVEPKAESLEFIPSAWTRKAYFHAEGIEGKESGFRYRKQGENNWIEVPDAAITHQGGVFSALIEELSPLTSYECQAYCGELTADGTFTTEGEEQLPNPGFEVFSNDESSNYKSWFSKAHSLWNRKWWDSGNVASTTVGKEYVICMPDPDTPYEGEACALLYSRYVIVKFAAGNIFSGEFAGLDGTTGGKVNFGRPFTARPEKLSLAIRYTSGKINYIGTAPPGESIKEGDNDRCQIFVALGDWDYRKYGGTPESPVQVNTSDKSTFFDPEGNNVIAYGSFIGDTSIPEWTIVDIPLEYKDMERKPTHIIVSCASSMLGDYFTGSEDSRLWIDDIKLIY